MQYPLAGWCYKNLPLYNPNVFFNKFVAEQKPNSLDLLNLGKWLYASFPDRHLDLQNLVWTRLEGATLINDDRLVQEIAYRAFKQRENKHRAETFQKAIAKGYTVLSHERDPKSQNKPEHVELKNFFASIFGENGFKAACIQILNDLPDKDNSIQDVVCTLLNLEIFKRSFSGRYADIARAAAILILGIYQRDGCEQVGTQGEAQNGSNFQQMMCNQVIDRAKYLEAKFKEGSFAKSNKVLIDLCLLVKAVFENSDGNLLAQPVSELPGLFQEKRTSLSVHLCKNYLLASRNLARLVSNEFKGGSPRKLRQILDRFDWDLGAVCAHFNGIPAPVRILSDYTQISLLLENLKSDLESFYSSIDSAHDDHWLYYDRNLDLAGIKGLISQPIGCFLSHLKNALNESVSLNENQKKRLLPDADKLRVNLRHLYEKRIVIAGIVDLYRQTKETKFKVKSLKMSGHSFHKTVADFGIGTNRVKLSNLITDLKVFDGPMTACAGDVLCSVTALKKDLQDYLESSIEESIGDAEEALDSCINFTSQISTMDFEQDFLEAFNDSTQKIAAFLETAAWLKHYFFVQKPIWECPLIEEINLKEEAVSNSTGKKTKKNKKIKQRRGRAVKPFVSKLVDDAAATQQVPAALNVPTTGQAPIAKQVSIAVQAPAAVNESPSSDDELEHSVDSTAEIWKAKVEKLRSMRQMAKHLKQTESVPPAKLQEPAMSSSVHEVLSGAFRRKLAGELSLLRKGKVSEILKEINKDGWTLKRIAGDHHIYSHPCLIGQMVIPYSSESEQLKKGTFNAIAKQAGWMASVG